MATGSVDGLVSGMSTSTIISQLMQVEAAPQTALKSKVTTQQKVQTSLQAVNTKIASLKTAADEIAKSTSWQAAKATSSSTTVTATTATTGANAGSVTFDVIGVAKAQTATSTYATANTPALANGATKVTLTIAGGNPVDVPVTTDTPQGVADAINAKGLDVRASVLTTDQGTVLQLTSAKTGTANGFQITGLAVNPTDVVPAADAKIRVGDVNGSNYTVTSPSNAVTSILNGVTINVSKLESNVTVTVDQDTGAIADKMKAFVDAANALMTEIANQTAVTGSGTSKTKQPLAGNSSMRQISQNVLGQIASGQTDFGSFAQIGVQLDRYGKLTFDKDKFTTAYKADPAKVMKAVTAEDPDAVTTAVDGTTTTRTSAKQGLAERLSVLAENSTKSVTNTITSGTNMITDLNKRIDDWDTRLGARRTALQKQFSGLEVALGKLKNQSTWLSGQLANLGSSE